MSFKIEIDGSIGIKDKYDYNVLNIYFGASKVNVSTNKAYSFDMSFGELETTLVDLLSIVRMIRKTKK